MCSLTLLFHINLIFASKVKMSSNLSSVPLDSSSSFHYEGTIQRTHFLLFETVAESVARISTLADHRPAFEKLLEYLQRQEKQYPDAYRHRHITTSTICDIGETRLIIRRWFKDDILSKAETTEQLRRVIQVAKVLEHLHQHRVVHGHLHPGNIFITARGDATVVDVSLHLFARAYTSQGFRIPLDSSSVYQAPEALDSRQTDLEPSSDVYAFASIVYAVRVIGLTFTICILTSASGDDGPLTSGCKLSSIHQELHPRNISFWSFTRSQATCQNHSRWFVASAREMLVLQSRSTTDDEGRYL
ncbi:hypothetical protein H2248_011463 [Termitomyces sp. 'cryptogamus']|nr:hypothetical protein H2248_011463 [Termitomyces sp. 'cryptogamus']